MNGKKKEDEAHIKNDDNIVYEEILDPRFQQAGRFSPPPFNRFAPPPFGGVVIEEEIIEEYEVDPNDNGEQSNSSVEENDSSIYQQNRRIENPTISRQIPYKTSNGAVQPKKFAKPLFLNVSSQEDNVKVRQQQPSKSGKYFLFILGILIFAGILVGIFFAFKSNEFISSMGETNTNVANAKPMNKIILRLPEGKSANIVKNFYDKISNSLTIPLMRDIIITGTIDFHDGEPQKSFYAIKRYDSGTFIKVGSDEDEKTYLISQKDNAVYLLEEGRTEGKKILLSPEKSGLLRALTEWDDDIYPAAFAMEMTGKRYNPTFNYIGEKNFRGRAAKEVQAEFADAENTSYYFDTKSELLVGISFPAGASEIKIEMGKYTTVDEIYKFPITRTIYYGDKKIADLNITFISVNRGLFFPM